MLIQDNNQLKETLLQTTSRGISKIGVTFVILTLTRGSSFISHFLFLTKLNISKTWYKKNCIFYNDYTF